ncbi:hypothetical protein [Niameybacter massiliensis]|uniref:hypothetical protein n=1 Tax=Niameybacter massiliensis TaxID=1658108 RepID=UPI0006B65906|nr:hypothetical protein [Niameybacter massiliensis]
MAKLKGELQADNGDVLHPHTSADVVFMDDGTSAEEKIKSIDQKITGIDVSGDVRRVVNERVNADTSKPLNTLINEWINSAKTAILNVINGLPQKSVWTDARGAKLDNLNQSMSTTQTNITTAVNSARDVIKNHITAETSGLKVYQPHASNVLATLCTAYAFSNGAQSYMGRFIAKRSGVIRVCFLTTNGTDNSRITVYTNPDVQATLSSSHGINSSYTSWEGLLLNTNIHNIGSPTYMTMKTVMEIGHKAVNNNKNCIFDMYVHEGQCLYFSGWYVGTATLKILGTEVVL